MSSFTKPLVVEVSDSGKDRLVEPFDFWYGEGDDRIVITVPAGFETDYASVPRVLRSFISSKKKAAKPAVIHDYLYSTGLVSKKAADKIFLEAMKVNEVNLVKRFTFYQAVNWFGCIAWWKSKKTHLQED